MLFPPAKLPTDDEIIKWSSVSENPRTRGSAKNTVQRFHAGGAWIDVGRQKIAADFIFTPKIIDALALSLR